MTKPLLVVEDDVDIRGSIREALEGEGYEVRTAGNGKEALDAIEQGFHPGLILLDLMMPVMDGWQFLEHVPDGIPVVVLSAYLTNAKTMSTAALVTRPVGFVRKPFHLERLLEIVQTTCGVPEPHRSQLVLVVDDDAEARDSFAALLADAGYEIVAAADGREALEKIRALRPAAVVLDMMLPVMTGQRVLAALANEGDQTPVVLVSGVVKAPTLAAAVDFLPKPCDPDALRTAVARAVARHAATGVRAHTG